MFVQDGIQNAYPRPRRRRGWGRVLGLSAVLRVAAIIFQRGRILLVEHRKRDQRYWVLPGGRLQGNETLDAALARELREELGLDARIGRLVIVCETLAPDRHVVNLIYQVEIGETAEPRLDHSDPVLAGWQWVSAGG